MQKLDLAKVQTLIDLAVQEDYGDGDPTSVVTVDENQEAKATLVSRESMFLSGMAIVPEILRRYDQRLKFEAYKEDGQFADVGDKLGVIEGPLRAMLGAERVILNFLQRLCGIATATNKYVAEVKDTVAKIYDTRKTTPGWRELEKYAVRCGGGCNHRYNLGDAVMFKDNHIAQIEDDLTGRLTEMVKQARAIDGVTFVCVEIDDIESQLEKVLTVPGVDIVLLDNMGQEKCRQAVEIRDRMFAGQENKPRFEASGGITLKNVRQLAESGVERISIGAITHGAIAVDIGLDR